MPDDGSRVRSTLTGRQKQLTGRGFGAFGLQRPGHSGFQGRFASSGVGSNRNSEAKLPRPHPYFYEPGVRPTKLKKPEARKPKPANLSAKTLNPDPKIQDFKPDLKAMHTSNEMRVNGLCYTLAARGLQANQNASPLSFRPYTNTLLITHPADKPQFPGRKSPPS